MRIIKGLEVKKILDQYVIIATGELSKSFHGVIKLNRTGYEIWDLIDKGRNEEQIVSMLISKYSISESKAKSDVIKIIQHMRDAGVIEG
jgi:hypothetical protein